MPAIRTGILSEFHIILHQSNHQEVDERLRSSRADMEDGDGWQGVPLLSMWMTTQLAQLVEWSRTAIGVT